MSREKAKTVIGEIIRHSAGDQLRGKTRLFKAFYFAHLFYAKSNSDMLTDWPIVRMPHGPGVDDFNSLINELVSSASVRSESENEGPYLEYVFTFVKQGWPSLTDEETKAIQESVRYVKGKSATELSDLTHEHSRSWNSAKDGDELSIYGDLLSDEEFTNEVSRSAEIDRMLQQAWNE